MELPVVTNCEGCGVCCTSMRTPPHMVFYVNEEYEPIGEDCQDDYNRLMAAPEEARQVRLAKMMGDAPDESPCSWLDPETKQCRWYEFRPDICRDFDVGGESCLSARKELFK